MVQPPPVILRFQPPAGPTRAALPNQVLPHLMSIMTSVPPRHSLRLFDSVVSLDKAVQSRNVHYRGDVNVDDVRHPQGKCDGLALISWGIFSVQITGKLRLTGYVLPEQAASVSDSGFVLD